MVTVGCGMGGVTNECSGVCFYGRKCMAVRFSVRMYAKTNRRVLSILRMEINVGNILAPYGRQNSK